ncbi:S-protein homolog 1-like [Momordica charantia]|uniref:S-protein homolog n=1 Tax=Momordica charantia TaxID=3673 RepID=A0A6J1DPK8_MOMCH|nr:S-protein homolog 1-like [Momordica charantia]
MVVLLVSSALMVVGAQQLLPMVDVEPKSRDDKRVWRVYVANGLSSEILFLHCKSKDTDIGERNLDLGAQIQWKFQVNFWGTTLYWCFMRKGSDSVSLDVFWVERKTSWLRPRCAPQTMSCIWIAKDDGIYIRNLSENVDEVIHKWNE